MNFELNKFYGDVMINVNDMHLMRMPSSIISMRNKLEDELLRKVLSEVLKRKATLEDAKRLTRVFRANDFDKYALHVDSIHIGNVEFLNSQFKLSIRFEPCNEFIRSKNPSFDGQ